MMFASTPTPIERMMPAIPGSVIVKLFANGKKPETAAKVIAIWPSSVSIATKPGRRNTRIMKTPITPKAITPAIIIASSDFMPIVGFTVLKFEVSSANGSAPP